MEPFRILCDKLLAGARSHSEKDKLREAYQLGRDGEWAVVWAEMNQVKAYYDRIMAAPGVV